MVLPCHRRVASTWAFVLNVMDLSSAVVSAGTVNRSAGNSRETVDGLSGNVIGRRSRSRPVRNNNGSGDVLPPDARVIWIPSVKGELPGRRDTERGRNT